MVMVRRFFPASKKIYFFMFIIYFVFLMLINGLSTLASQADGSDPLDEPPIDNNSPSVTLQNCLNWYETNHPTPVIIFHEGQCKEIVGYKGTLSWWAIEFMDGTGRFLDGSCITSNSGGQDCTLSGTIGETTGKLIELESFEFLSPDAHSALEGLEAYDFKVYGFVRCTEPVLRIEPEKKSILVNEMIPIIVSLDCYDERMGYMVSLIEPIILEVVSGPGELDLPELTPEELDMLEDSGYSLNQNNIMMTNLVDDAMLYATDAGTIEIKATYEGCRGETYHSTITKIAKVNVGQWAVIECTYQTDPERFGDDGLQWGGTIHCEACLEAYEQVQYGMKVKEVRGYARGSQDCWVKIDDEYSWIENKKCPAFTGVIEGAIWGNVYTFRVSIDDSAALTFDLCSGEKERPQRLTRHEWDPVNFIGVPIHLDASNPNAVYIYEEESDIIGTQYKVVAHWQ